MASYGRWGLCLLLTALGGMVLPAPAGARSEVSLDRSELSLDRTFAAYAAGDHGIVARTIVTPDDFKPLQLEKPRVLEEWLGTWNPRKAAFLIDLARTANVVSPTKTWPILSAGRRYVTDRRGSPNVVPDEDFQRTWHHAALGLLQQHNLVTYEEMYLDGLRLPSPSAADRITLAHGIAQEQRCWNDRLDLARAGEAADAVTRAAGATVTTREDVSRSALASARTRQETCWQDALTRFAGAFSSDGAGAEAHVRSAWILFQLGRPQDALAMLEGVTPADDRELAYWAGLFRGRINDALGRHAEAERAYRAALEASPGAQSAGIGLALTLFKMNRDAEADAIALDVRTRSRSTTDPWWAYPTADHRFVDRWIDTLRGAR